MTRLRQSQIKNFFDCELKYVLSLTNQIEQTKAMKMGNIFEAYVFDEKKEKLEWDAIEKGMTKQMKSALSTIADHVKPIFTKGKPFKEIELITDRYHLTGEADWIGYFNYQGIKYKGIVDLKLTGSIVKIWGLGDSSPDFGLKEWDGKLYKDEYLQSFAYPYIHYKKTGNIMPFYYLVVESDTIENMLEKTPLMKMFDCTPTVKDFMWFESVINKIITLKKSPFIDSNYRHCIECQFFKSRLCVRGINEFSKMEKIHLSQLESK